MPDESRHSVRIPVPAEQQTAALRIGRREMEVRLLNVSSGGCSVMADPALEIELGAHVQVRTAAGWTAAKVVSHSQDELGSFIGLQWLCDAVATQPARKRRAGRRGVVTSLKVELGMLVLLAVCGWGAITALQQLSNPTAKADNTVHEQQPAQVAGATNHLACRREAALAVRNAMLERLNRRDVRRELDLTEEQTTQLRRILDESLVAYLHEKGLLPHGAKLPRKRP
jgi:hypothetical protein